MNQIRFFVLLQASTLTKSLFIALSSKLGSTEVKQAIAALSILLLEAAKSGADRSVLKYDLI